jgi:uncharacterized protein YbaR (Trm112 family)
MSPERAPPRSDPPAPIDEALGRALEAVLACPACGGGLRAENPAAEGTAEPRASAEVVCEACARRFPVIGGVLDLLSRPRP